MDNPNFIFWMLGLEFILGILWSLVLARAVSEISGSHYTANFNQSDRWPDFGLDLMVDVEDKDAPNGALSSSKSFNLG